MVTDDQVLVDDDMYILERIKDFLSEPDVSSVPAAKTLMNVIDRKVGVKCSLNQFRSLPFDRSKEIPSHSRQRHRQASRPRQSFRRG